MSVEFRPLGQTEREQLTEALRRNATDGAALRLDPAHTGWVPGESDMTDREIVNAIRSIPCHYADNHALRLALELLRGNDTYIADARAGAPVGNSVVGSLLSLQHSIPRQYAEEAVRHALTIIDSSSAESIETDHGGNYTLPRSGRAPLRFQGELLAESEGYRYTGREQTRWHNIAIYRTAGGKYVVSIQYRTRYQGETDHDAAEVIAQPSGVEATLREYDPIAIVRGFPANDHYADRQARLQTDIRQRYEAQVSDVLADRPEFAEVME
jgi:hypothetical protein